MEVVKYFWLLQFGILLNQQQKGGALNATARAAKPIVKSIGASVLKRFGVFGKGVERERTRLISSINRVSSNVANKPFLTEKAVAEGWSPPYPSDLSLREITASDSLSFVRVHTNPNQPAGGFLVRRKALQELQYNPESIRLHLGLPEMPIYISDVNIPAQTRLMVGRIGAQPHFGLMKTTGFQYQLLEQVPLSSFSNTRLLNELQESTNLSIYMKP